MAAVRGSFPIAVFTHSVLHTVTDAEPAYGFICKGAAPLTSLAQAQ